MNCLMDIASRLARIIGVLACAGLFAGCSTIKLGYNNLDEIAYWWLDGYVDLEEGQSQRVREDLARLHLWHRTQELPKVSALLARLEQIAPADVTAAQVCGLVNEVRERFTAISEQAEPAAAALALGLSTAQLQQLERKYRRNDAEFRKEWIDTPSAELEDRRLKRIVERSENVYGRLDAAQRAAIRQRMAQARFDAQRTMVERQRRHADVLQTLRSMAGQPMPSAQARRQVRELLARSLESPDAGYRAFQQGMVDQACADLAALHNSTTAMQREAAVRRLRAWQRDLSELAAQR